MTKPLTPDETNELLRPNPTLWGPDGYPTGEVLGFKMIVNPDMPIDHVGFALGDRMVGRIINVSGELIN